MRAAASIGARGAGVGVETTIVSSDALLSLIKSALAVDGTPGFSEVVLYTSFGVVRGKLGLLFGQQLQSESAERVASNHHVIELNDASVEHYSNHLPTATFDRFYVRLGDVLGYALVGSHGQS